MSSDGVFLATAAGIGRRIVSDAVWDDGRCSWMGALAEPPVAGRPVYRALGPSLYGGTAGMGLFLAQLAAATDEISTRRTAIGALHHALARTTSVPPAQRDGFHAGVLGVVWAAASAAALIGEEELHARAGAVLTEATLPSGSDRCPDLVKGSAGSIVGALSLAAMFEDPRLTDDAIDAGGALIERAVVTRHGWSWPTQSKRYPAHLCGVSHGAAGIGWALLELYATTGEQRFRDGANGAFAYERSWLDARSGTWPDLRIGGQRRGAPRTTASPAEGTWCYGEAGIALTRLRAIAVLGPGPHAHDAHVALETTRRHLVEALPYAIEDFSLCHGAGGAADALLCSAGAPGEPSRSAADLAADLGHVMLERHASPGTEWPCGVDGTTPGLFAGLSGIAWLFLRLHDRAIRSPLTLPITVDISVR
jgi:lantibiotic modifying enzyme